MLKLTDFYIKYLHKPFPTDCGLACEQFDKQGVLLNSRLTERVSSFSYTLILSGTRTLTHNDKTTFLAKNDLFITTPGMIVRTLSVSDDYLALSLIGDESATYEIPFARNVICASYSPDLICAENKLTLTDEEARWMEKRLREIIIYIDSNHQFKKECLSSLYSLFMLDLLDMERRFKKSSEVSPHIVDQYLKFLKLLSSHFATQHEISFYATELSVTTIYLSRIVKKISGKTVKNHIDRLILIEASHLLLTTDIPISIIAEKLNFANPASFCKFFTKHKEISPSEYRKSDWKEPRPRASKL